MLLTWLLLGMIFALGIFAIILGQTWVVALVNAAIVLTATKRNHLNDEKRKNDEKPKREWRLGDDGELGEANEPPKPRQNGSHGTVIR